MKGLGSKLYGRHITSRLLVPASSILLLALGFVSAVKAADFSGQVVSVLDGDTIEVLHNNRAERIRLNRIDCQTYSLVAPHNRVEFNSTAEAEEAG